jgi:hypothetical protein
MLLNPWEKNLQRLVSNKLFERHSLSGLLTKEKNLLLSSGVEPRFLGYSARILDCIPYIAVLIS